MKDELTKFGITIGLFGLVGIAMIIIHHRSTTPKHQAGEYYEKYTSGNEFQDPKLLTFGQIIKVGKESYLVDDVYCSSYISINKEVIGIEIFDNYYKIVNKDKAFKDIDYCRSVK